MNPQSNFKKLQILEDLQWLVYGYTDIPVAEGMKQTIMRSYLIQNTNYIVPGEH